jgi:uncharacterized membrane protein
MAYDQSKLVSDVRIYLGGVSEDKLPDATIVFYGDFYDADEEYTGKYPYILWRTTLACLDYLRANITTSSSTTSKSSRKEKVGGVEVTVTTDTSAASVTTEAYDDLYQDYKDNPWKFGIKGVDTKLVIINGVDQDTVDKYRDDENTTSIYNPLPTTAFPKTSGQTWRRNDSDRRYRR